MSIVQAHCLEPVEMDPPTIELTAVWVPGLCGVFVRPFSLFDWGSVCGNQVVKAMGMTELGKCIVLQLQLSSQMLREFASKLARVLFYSQKM